MISIKSHLCMLRPTRFQKHALASNTLEFYLFMIMNQLELNI